ncbi:MAG TPA: toll/interleukin-1 receptor domain-containing protein [Ktedonobacteraceae bacterium]|nr:toll/interleukin-1 receptor domain-containing protein [Ktedonobacteraceae bacterium]
MANQEHLDILSQGVKVWNTWRQEHPEIRPDLSKANLKEADLGEVDFTEVNLNRANLSEANLGRADLRKADLSRANLREANLYSAYLEGANLKSANFKEADLNDAHLYRANLSKSHLFSTDLNGADLRETDLSNADLRWAFLYGAYLNKANLNRADLRGASLIRADLNGADLSAAVLSGALLVEAHLREANLCLADLSGADLSDAILTGVVACEANFIGCRVHGISVWDTELEGASQLGLIITPENEPEITVDNLELAQFIYLLLNNQDIRQVIDTITSHVVLILGHFTGERKAILEVLRRELRVQHYSPVVFDFEELAGQDFIETVRTLANMARFVLIDLTDLENALDDIVKVVPHCRVPMQPLLFLDSHQHKYSQFLDLRRNHRWILPLHCYQDNSSLLASLQEKIIQVAEEKSEELKQRIVIQIFFYYALEDLGIFLKLKKHLSLLERSGQIAAWDVQQLAPGEEKGKEVEKRLSDAHIILLLVSPDFLSSDNCTNIQEMAMERYGSGDATVIPLILRPCGWKSTPLGKLQALPRDEKPLARRDLGNILFEVTDEIADMVKKLLRV